MSGEYNKNIGLFDVFLKYWFEKKIINQIELLLVNGTKQWNNYKMEYFMIRAVDSSTVSSFWNVLKRKSLIPDSW